MSKQLDNVGPRLIPRGSCNWCGHKLHPDVCSSSIRTAVAEAAPCPCPRRTEGTR